MKSVRGVLNKRIVDVVSKKCATSAQSVNATASCPHLIGLGAEVGSESGNFMSAKPYSEVPGPKALPLLGNSWR